MKLVNMPDSRVWFYLGISCLTLIFLHCGRQQIHIEDIVNDSAEDSVGDISTDQVVFDNPELIDVPSVCRFSNECPEPYLCLSGQCEKITCEEPKKFCYRGLIATCNGDGTKVHLESCPEGEVCGKDGVCMPNHLNLYFWVDGPDDKGDRVWADIEFLFDLQNSTESVLGRPECSKTLELFDGTFEGECGCPGLSGWFEYSRNYGAAIRFLLREALSGLAQDDRISYLLAHNGQAETEPADTCMSTDWDYNIMIGLHPECSACLSPPSCIFGEYYWGCSVDRYSVPILDAYWNKNQRKIDVFRFLPLTTEEIPGLNEWVAENMIAVPLTTDSAQLYLWLDEKEEIGKTGETCSSDFDCSVGFCKDDACYTHTNPELAPVRTKAMTTVPINSPWALSHYISRAGRPEGWPCMDDDDCPNPTFTCGPDRTCHDEARYCRRHHLVIASPFMGMMNPISGNFRMTNSALSILDLTRWLSIGLVCHSDEDCSPSAYCSPSEQMTTHLGVETGFCSTSSRDPSWATISTGMCSQTELEEGCGNSFVKETYETIAFVLGQNRMPASSRPVDSMGVPMTIVTSTIGFEHIFPSLPGVPTFNYLTSFVAIATAISGGGTYLVPAASDSFALAGYAAPWKSQVESLVDFLETDLNTSRCEQSSLPPADVPAWLN